MISNLSNKLAIFLVHTKKEESDMLEVYQYGLQLLLSTLINVVLTMFLGILFHRVIETILFLMVYCTIRQKAGGYHASSHFRCIAGFFISYTGILLIINYIALEKYKGILTIFMIISIIFIFFYAPVESTNNKLSVLAKEKMNKSAKICCIVYGIISIAMMLAFDKLNIYGIIVAMAIIWASIIMLLGKKVFERRSRNV